MPSPGRTNPFELSSESQEQAQTELSGGKRDIRVAGFVGSRRTNRYAADRWKAAFIQER